MTRLLDAPEILGEFSVIKAFASGAGIREITRLRRIRGPVADGRETSWASETFD